MVTFVRIGGSRPPADGWSSVSRRFLSGTSEPAGADGEIEVLFDIEGGDQAWELSHVTITTNSALRTRLRVYLDAMLIDGSNSGNFDVAEYPTPLFLDGGQTLAFRWEGATPGSVATVVLQRDQLQRDNDA